jgi:hypothetical protein
MKMKFILFVFVQLFSFCCFSQYIGVKAKYTETRLVDDAPNPPKRENRLILSFYEVSDLGVFTPVTLSNYDIWVLKQGFQYGNVMGGVLDSTGNNYPGYAWPAPIAVSYYNSLGLNYIDCDPNAATHFVVNGHELDCGFITVSYWEMDYGTGVPFEAFPAPNICLPYYFYPDPYYLFPGNIHFPYVGTPPYNWYNFSCGGTLQLVIRGVLPADSSAPVVLPVRFANVEAAIDAANRVQVSWSNMTESDVLHYDIESSPDGNSFQCIGTMLPSLNNGGRADYDFYSIQTAPTIYYRIKAVENNGTIAYSSIVLLRQSIPSIIREESFSIYPNPVTGGECRFRLSNAVADRYLFRLLNATGQQMSQGIIAHNSGDLIHRVDMKDLPPGIYRLVLQSSSKRYTQQIFYAH